MCNGIVMILYKIHIVFILCDFSRFVTASKERGSEKGKRRRG